MEKVMGRKKLIAVFAVVAIVVLGVLAYVMAFGNRKQSYRSIKIVEMEGNVAIDRDGMESLDASVNMNLVSGDYVTTAQDSYVVLRLDADKYVMLGEGGAMKVTAEGDEQNGRTSIELASGSVLNEIQNPLGQNSTFDIVTPNATMSVRGTVFEVRKNSDGTYGVLVYDGHVAVGLDGMEPVVYDAGEYAEFTEGATPEFLTEKGTITEAQMDEKVWERLQEIQNQGRDMNLDVIQKASDANAAVPEPANPQTPAESEALTQEKELAQTKEQEAAQKEAEQKTAEQKEAAAQKEAEQKAAETQKKELAQAQPQTQKPAQSKPQVQPQVPAQNEAMTQAPEQNQAPTAEPDMDIDDDDDEEEPDVQPVPSEPENPDKPEQPATPENPATPEQPDTPEQPATPENPDKPEQPATPEQPDTPENPDKPEQPDTPENPDKPDQPLAPEQCTVTYKLPYVVISVTEGETVYSYLEDIEPVDYMVKKGDEIDWESVTIDKTPGYKWNLPGGATQYNIIGWCTEDGTQWNFQSDVVEKDMALYPIWDNNGKRFYPVIYTDPNTGKTYCNSIEQNSVPEVLAN